MAVLDVLILKKVIEDDLGNCISLTNVIAYVISRNEKVEEVVDIEPLNQSAMFAPSFLKHVSWCA